MAANAARQGHGPTGSRDQTHRDFWQAEPAVGASNDPRRRGGEFNARADAGAVQSRLGAAPKGVKALGR